MLESKRLLITGVINRNSLAFAVAREAQRLGAEVALTSFGRVRRMTERSATRLDPVPPVFELDARDPDSFAGLTQSLRAHWGGVDGALHSMAYAPADAVGGSFLATPLESALDAFTVSAYSLSPLAGALRELFPPEGGAIAGLDFDASVAWPAYNWMGVAKAGFEAVSRYLARELGQDGIRVNLVSAGPIATAAAGGIEGFQPLAEAWAQQAPLGWDVDDPEPVARTVCFLLSDYSRGITGEIIHVDGGFHAVGAADSAAVGVETAL